jgi:hypothetical protein
MAQTIAMRSQKGAVPAVAAFVRDLEALSAISAQTA